VLGEGRQIGGTPELGRGREVLPAGNDFFGAFIDLRIDGGSNLFESLEDGPVWTSFTPLWRTLGARRAPFAAASASQRRSSVGSSPDGAGAVDAETEPAWTAPGAAATFTKSLAPAGAGKQSRSQ